MNYTPSSFRLYDESECKQFFTHIESDEYNNMKQKEGIVYIIKEGKPSNNGQGVHLLTDD